MFADDTIVYHQIKTPADHVTLEHLVMSLTRSLISFFFLCFLLKSMRWLSLLNCKLSYILTP